MAKSMTIVCPDDLPEFTSLAQAVQRLGGEDVVVEIVNRYVEDRRQQRKAKRLAQQRMVALKKVLKEHPELLTAPLVEENKEDEG